MEAGVLQQGDARTGLLEADVVAEQVAQPLRDRAKRELRVGPFWSPEMRADVDRRRTALEEELDRRQRGADARVVGDGGVGQRDVQVCADEDTAPADVGVADGPRLTQ
jgi:hypothetical protein